MSRGQIMDKVKFTAQESMDLIRPNLMGKHNYFNTNKKNFILYSTFETGNFSKWLQKTTANK